MVLIQFPPKSTDWLKVLAEDSPGNLTFQRNLSLGNKELGFSLKTNENGYRGESFNGQKYMAVGTSFGASVGVDEEDAWFNNLICNVSNLSFPCSNLQHLANIKKLDDNLDTLIYIYHPNVLITSLSFFNYRKVGGSYFKYMGWKLNLGKYDYLKFYLKFFSKILSGRITFRWRGSRFFMLDRAYCISNYPNSFLEEEKRVLKEIFLNFQKVYVVRVPIKEELGLRGAAGYFDKQWHLFCEMLPPSELIDLVGFFNLLDYHSLDNHWNVSGNSKFADLLGRFVISNQAD